MTDKTLAELTAEVTATLNNAIADLETALAETGADHILAWDNGLGVMINNGLASACSLDRATAQDGRTTITVTNGKHEHAKFTTRKAAIDAYLPQLRASLAHLTERAQ